jgi:hypothetical protein
MKINQIRWPLRLLLLNASVLLLTAGCATHNERSYNQDFNQNLSTAPKYTIEDVDDTHFKIIVHQGSPVDGPQRVTDVKQAASAVAETEAKHRDWQNWNLDYVQERDQGWMHIVIANVTRENAIGNNSSSTRNNP